MQNSEKFALYIHIPFCISRCTYCDFYTLLEREKIDNYTDAVLLELKKWASRTSKVVSSVYFGGGTPTVLQARNLTKILSYIKENYIIEEGAEIALEANPNKLEASELEMLNKAGFNRISFGMQSAVDEELRILARTHRNADVKRAVEMARKSGFKDISLDLMIGIPSQTKTSLDVSLSYIKSLDVEHISVYMLQLEEGTPLYKMKDKLEIPDEDLTADFYKHTVDTLSNSGFLQYEISNFAKKGYHSRHNLSYWNGDKFLGIGPSAYSYMDGKRFSYENNLDLFIENAKKDGIEIINLENVEEYVDYLMLRLRLKEGIVFSLTEKIYPQFKEDIEGILKRAKDLENHGLLRINEDSLNLTKEGFLLSNSVTLKLLEGII